MQATIRQWGNSLALRLPRHVADRVRLFEGTTVELEIEDDGAIKIIPSRKKFKLADLLKGEQEKRAAARETETDWGKPCGDEAW